MRHLILGGLLVALVASAGADSRKPIQQAYERSSKAMTLKFIDGVLSIRSPHFRLIDPDGVERDQRYERGLLEQLLVPSLRVQEESKITGFSQQGRKAHCLVHYRTCLVRLDPTTRQEMTLRIETDCDDDWVQIGPDWFLETSRVTHQETQRVKKP